MSNADSNSNPSAGESGPEPDDHSFTPKAALTGGRVKVYHSKPFTIWNQLGRVIFCSPYSIVLAVVVPAKFLLFVAPASITDKVRGIDEKSVFMMNLLVIIAAIGILSVVMDDILLHFGQGLGGLLNAAFGNAVEMTIAIIALAKGEVSVVRFLLMGTIFSNLLHVTSLYHFGGSLRPKEQYVNRKIAHNSILQLSLGIMCFDFGEFSNTRSLPTAAACINVLVSYGLLVTLLKSGGGSAIVILPNGDGKMTQPNIVQKELDERERPRLHIAVAWVVLAGAMTILGIYVGFIVDSIPVVAAPDFEGSSFFVVLPIAKCLLLPRH